MNAVQTTKIFQELKYGADHYINHHNIHFLSNLTKSYQNFTRNEAMTYLGVDGKTIDKYATKIGVDPRRHKGSQWSLNIEEIYKIRDIFPEFLRKDLKFKRTDNQLTQIIVIQNQKEEVRKIVSSATIASGLATEFHQELRIGLVDMDTEALLSMYYAPDAEQEEYLSVGDLMMRNFNLDDGETFEDVVSKSFLPTIIPNLRILPTSKSDSAIEGWFHDKVLNNQLENPYSILSEVIDVVKDEFDVIIINTPSSLSYKTYNSYFAATSVIFPVSITKNDIDNICYYFSCILQLWELLLNIDHPGYNFIRILITDYCDFSVSSENKNTLYKLFSPYLYPKKFISCEEIYQKSSIHYTVFDLPKSTYKKNKAKLKYLQQNAVEVTNQIMHDIMLIWAKQERK